MSGASPAALARWEDDGGPRSALAAPHEGEALRLRDGRRVWVRRVEVSDGAVILGFLERLGLDSRRMRFFSAACDLRSAAHWSASVDVSDHVGLLAVDDEQRVLGHAAYVRLDGPGAEVAVEVADEMHHLGLGTVLLLGLGRIAETSGIDHFVAEVLPENREMLAVFHDGFDSAQHPDDGVVKIAFPTSNWRLAERRFAHPFHSQSPPAARPTKHTR